MGLARLLTYYRLRIFPNLKPLLYSASSPDAHSFQEVATTLPTKTRRSVRNTILKWENSFRKKHGRKPSLEDINQNQDMHSFYVHYRALKALKASSLSPPADATAAYITDAADITAATDAIAFAAAAATAAATASAAGTGQAAAQHRDSKTHSQSAPDVAISSSWAQPDPSASAALHNMDAPICLLRAQILSRATSETQNDFVERQRRAKLLSAVQNAAERPPQTSRPKRGAFQRTVLQSSSTSIQPVPQSDGDDPPASEIPEVFPSLLNLHPETRAALKQFGLFPFEKDHKIPWDRNFFFPEQINIDEPGDAGDSEAIPSFICLINH